MWAADPRSFSHGQNRWNVTICVSVSLTSWSNTGNRIHFLSFLTLKRDRRTDLRSSAASFLWRFDSGSALETITESLSLTFEQLPSKFRPAVREMESGMLLQMSMAPMCLLKSMPSGHRMRNVIANGLRLRGRQMERHATPAWIDWQTFNTNISVCYACVRWTAASKLNYLPSIEKSGLF